MERRARVRYGRVWVYDLEDVGDDAVGFCGGEGWEAAGCAFTGWCVDFWTIDIFFCVLTRVGCLVWWYAMGIG